MVKKVGIDAIGFYSSHYYLDLAELAQARNVNVDKFHIGLGQYKMAVPAPDEDIITLGANAAQEALSHIDPNKIDHIIFATESGHDQSKAAATYIQRLLNLPKQCRVIELKQACYACTAAIQFAAAIVARHPESHVLIVSSDISRYGLGTTGESSQGCAAVAMVISANPRLLAVEPGAGFYAEEVMDFWRPNYLDEALVDGKYSAVIYLRAIEESFKDYQHKTNRAFSEIDYHLYHAPVPRLVQKAHHLLSSLNGVELTDEEVMAQTVDALYYPSLIGNSYTASLYVSLISLLDNSADDLSGKRIGFYSYGSGCMAEYFSGVVQSTYLDVLDTARHQDLLARRHALSYNEYEQFYQFQLPTSGEEFTTPRYQSGNFRLSGIRDHQRQYQAIPKVVGSVKRKIVANDEAECVAIKTISPGKIILSGEHSVVYGEPALALAVNRYATTTITPDFSKMISLNLLSSRYKDSVTIKTLREVKSRLKQKYEDFLAGDCSIRDVLQTPFELTEFVLINFMDRLNTKILDGLNLHTESTIPVGCGMGSSAALILSVLLAVSRFLNIPLNKSKLLRLAVEAENLQHGRSSSLDLQTAYQGGCVYFSRNQIYQRAIPKFPLYVVNTGAPISTTGESVEQVRRQFEKAAIWHDFGETTRAIDSALQLGDRESFGKLLRENQRLLNAIGVVPSRVNDFIVELEKMGAAAKVCGAGATSGDSAGIVLVAADELSQIEAICARYGFDASEIAGETRGVHVA